MTRVWPRLCWWTILLLGSAGAYAGGTPLGTAFTYQGQFKVNGAAASGTYHLRFQLWDALAGGAQVGSDIDEPAVAITEGLFTTPLDFGPGAFDGAARWLTVQVVTNGGNTVTTLVPRRPIAAAPYALYALATAPLTAAALPTGGAWSLSSGLSLDSSTLQVDPVNHRIGIGTAAPQSALDVAGTARVAGFQLPAGAAFGKILRSDSTGIATWQNDSVTLPYFGSTSFPTGAGFEVQNSGGTLDQAIAIYGSATGGSAVGVYGRAYNGGDAGVKGSILDSSGISDGGYFENASTEGRGVRGHASAATGTTYGGYFSAASNDGTGVYGQATDYGGFLLGSGSNGVGVYGLATALGAAAPYGGYFECRAPNGGQGLHAVNIATSGLNYGVVGETLSASGYGVYSLGRTGASGTKSFRIDHPDDPANKYLLHYSIESPEVLNDYSGKVVLDSAGEALVELPAYFAKINRDPRYTLTAIGAAMPNLHVAQEIDEAALAAGAAAGATEPAPACSFRITGGVPGAKVSWEVKAVRNDAWVRHNGAPVEEDKPEHERGRYQHPELYDQPAETAIGYPQPFRTHAQSGPQ